MDAIQQQPIQVTFNYPVVFTTRSCSAGQPDAARHPRSTSPRDISGAGAVRRRPRRRRRPAGPAGRHRPLLPRARRHGSSRCGPPLVIDGGEAAKNDPPRARAGPSRPSTTPRAVPPFVRGGDRRRRGARRRRLRRGDGASRRPADSRADDGAGAGRLGGRRQERRQRVRQEELPRHLRAAVRRDQRLRVPRDAVRSRLARRASPRRSRSRSSATRRSSTASSAMRRGSSARDAAAMERLVRRSAALHLAHIATGGDPFELGSSRPLDFGHWAAHKLEQLTDHRLRHGEAVGDRHRARQHLRAPAGLPAGAATGGGSSTCWSPSGFDLSAPELVAARSTTRRTARVCSTGSRSSASTSAATLTIMLLRGIGQPFDVHEIDRDAMIRSIELVARAQDATRGREAPPAGRPERASQPRPP